jgi:RecB family exonuclease
VITPASLQELAATAKRAGVTDLILASVVADEDPARSALAAALLSIRNAQPESLATGCSVPSERSELGDASPIDPWNAAHLFGIDIDTWQKPDVVIPRPDVVFRASAASSEVLDVWNWPQPESPRPLAAPGMTFSASRLNSFAKCPRRWFFEYLCDAVDDPGSVHATYGKVFHEALEALHRDVRVPSEYTEDEIRRRLQLELTGAFERARADFASPLEYEVSRLKARAVAEHYARWLVQEAHDQPMRIEEVEALQKWGSGGHAFVGYIDRIDRPLAGGSITIFDYKTGRIDDDPENYVRDVRAGREAQLALYYNVRRAGGDDVARLALVSLRDPRDKAWVLAIDVTDEAGKPVAHRASRPGVLRAACTSAQLEEAMRALLERCDLLTRKGLERFEAGDDPPCSFCAYARACRVRPVEAERVFAR